MKILKDQKQRSNKYRPQPCTNSVGGGIAMRSCVKDKGSMSMNVGESMMERDSDIS